MIKRGYHTAKMKAKVALEALREHQTSAELASKYQVDVSQINRWKAELLEGAEEVFAVKRGRKKVDEQRELDELYMKIGKLEVKNEFLEGKLLSLAPEVKVGMIDRDHPKLSVREQVQLLDLTRSSLYYQPRPTDAAEETLKREISTQYLATPFYGARKMVIHLKRLGYEVGRKLVRRLMAVLGLEAIFPKPNLSKRNQAHKVYPYLLGDLTIERPNHVWATDITYIPTPGGHVYLVAILDWASRKVLSWRLSNTLSTHFCLEALDEAIEANGKPEIFNTDQGCQFTSTDFTDRLKAKSIAISMDSKGRCLDNIIVERFWRSLKYEMIYLHEFTTMNDLRERIGRYVIFYNNERPHQSHGYETPAAVYSKAA